MKDLISVIVPVYNIERYISKCINSIIAQTYNNLEIIIVDDGSTDNTGKIADDFSALDSRIKVIHKCNGGVTSARLKGISSATGDWIGFVDGDDYIEPEMYEHLLKNALDFNADISHCGYRMVFLSGKIDYYYNTKKIIQQNNITGLIDLLEGRFIEPGLVTKLYRSALFNTLLEHKLMDLSIKNTEDLLMNYYLFKNSNKSVFEDITPYHYLLRPNSAATSTINENKLNDPIKVIKIIRDDCKDMENNRIDAILTEKLIRQHINIATIRIPNQSASLKKLKKDSKKELKMHRKSILTDKRFGNLLKLMTLMASLSTKLYAFVHSIHGLITGNNKKYDISK